MKKYILVFTFIVLVAFFTVPSFAFGDTSTSVGDDSVLQVQGFTEDSGEIVVKGLAFTGIDPIIPMSGGIVIVCGIVMLGVSLRKRNKCLANNVSQEVNKEGTEQWLNIL